MYKTILLLTALIFISISAQAQYQYDTLAVKQIGDGVFHYSIEEPTVPWRLELVEIDLTKSHLKLETVKAGDSMRGYEKTSSMAAKKSVPGHRVIAAINGDFYGGGGIPTNTQVLQGEMLKGPINREIFGYSDNNTMFINTTSYSGMLRTAGDSTEVTGVNRSRGTDKLIFFNHYNGSSTGTNQYGTEVRFKAIDNWVVNGEVRAIVQESYVNAGDAVLDDSSFVLSGHGSSAAFLKTLSQGDTVSVEHRLNPGTDNLKEAVGGSRKFLVNGELNGNWPDRHPRSALAFNADTTKFYLLTVDGRQSSSAGMTLNEMGAFLKTVGASHALNLDGGGSTTLVVHNEVANSPSDGTGERSVANALMLVSSNEKTGMVEHLTITPGFSKIYKGKSLSFSAYASDENYYPIPLEAGEVTYRLSDGFNASIDNEGTLTAGNAADTGYVYIDFDGKTDSALVIVKGITDLNIFPQETVTDLRYTPQMFTRAFDFDGREHAVANTEIEWSSEDPSVAEIDENGTIHGINEGATFIYGSYDGNTDTTRVTVIEERGSKLVDGFEESDAWSLDGLKMNLQASGLNYVSADTNTTEGESALKLDYQFTYDGDPDVWAYIEQDIAISGIPDTIYLDGKTDGLKHLFEINITDDNGEEYYIRLKRWADNTEYNTYAIVMDDLLPSGSKNNFYYPVSIKNIGIKLAQTGKKGEVYSGSIYLDNLRVSYPNKTVVSTEDEGKNLPSDITLEPNFPNPFNPSTKITFQLPNAGNTALEVYDVAGRKVSTLVNQRLNAGSHTYTFDASGLASGVYLYRLEAAGSVLSRKMVLIK